MLWSLRLVLSFSLISLWHCNRELRSFSISFSRSAILSLLHWLSCNSLSLESYKGNTAWDIIEYYVQLHACYKVYLHSLQLRVCNSCISHHLRHIQFQGTDFLTCSCQISFSIIISSLQRGLKRHQFCGQGLEEYYFKTFLVNYANAFDICTHCISYVPLTSSLVQGYAHSQLGAFWSPKAAPVYSKQNTQLKSTGEQTLEKSNVSAAIAMRCSLTERKGSHYRTSSGTPSLPPSSHRYKRRNR